MIDYEKEENKVGTFLDLSMRYLVPDFWFPVGRRANNAIPNPRNSVSTKCHTRNAAGAENKVPGNGKKKIADMEQWQNAPKKRQSYDRNTPLFLG